jgi:hypothetical protein
MVILTTSGSAQTFEFTPRSDAYNTMIVTNEATNVPVTVTISSSAISTYYHTITATFSLLEGNYYTIILKQNSTVVWKGRMYCTDQTTLPQYTVNSGVYTSQSSTNQYIIL